MPEMRETEYDLDLCVFLLSMKREKRNTVQAEALHGVMNMTNRPDSACKIGGKRV